MEYKDIEIPIGEIQEGDLVFCPDGKWHEIEVLPIQNKCFYKLTTSAGTVRCSYDHYWVLYKDGKRQELSTSEIYGILDELKGWNIGVEDGATLLDLEMLEEGECRCISVKDSDDHQFLIFTEEGNPIFTRNCQARIVCGQLGSTASKMALGNHLATTIDGDHKGAGIVSINNVKTNCQYYFAKPEWIENWYADRGFDKNGYPIGDYEVTDEEISLGDDDEELVIGNNNQHFEFEDNEKDVINRKEQNFENI